jgi:hypothetical protein
MAHAVNVWMEEQEMAWQMTGRWLESCSCKMTCRCIMGPAEPDQGWCSIAFLIDIQRGNSEGVNLDDTRAVWALDLPGDLVSGNGTARVWLDERTSSEQRRELEAILTGNKSGVWEALAGLVTTWLPSKTARVEVGSGDNLSFSVADIGRCQFQPVEDAGGNQAQVVNAPENYGVAEVFDLARADGSRWSDPEMRTWESLGWGQLANFNWSV